MKKRTKIFFAAAVIFLSGFLSGTVLGPPVHFMVMDFFRPPPSPSQFNEKLSNKIAGDLKLTQEQREDLIKKLTPKMEAFAAEHKMVKDAFGKMLDITLMEIQPALTQEQKKRFEEMKKEREAREARGEGRHGPHMPGEPPPHFR